MPSPLLTQAALCFGLQLGSFWRTYLSCLICSDVFFRCALAASRSWRSFSSMSMRAFCFSESLPVEETEEETEVELAQAEPPFLKGQTRKSGRDLEPVKIIKSPDGSMQRSAMQQVSLAKERRELRQAQANQLLDSIPKDLK